MATRTAAQRRAGREGGVQRVHGRVPEPQAARPRLRQVGDSVCSLGRWPTAVLGGPPDPLAGVSQKMLTQTLRTLERDGLVSREVTPSVPVARRLRPDRPRPLAAAGPLELMKAWAEEHMSLVQVAQEDYDRGQAISA